MPQWILLQKKKRGRGGVDGGLQIGKVKQARETSDTMSHSERDSGNWSSVVVDSKASSTLTVHLAKTAEKQRFAVQLARLLQRTKFM